MIKKIIYLLIIIFSINFVFSFPIGFDNPNLPKLEKEEVNGILNITYTNITYEGVDFSVVQNWSDDNCPSGYYAYSRYQNGTWKCREDTGGGGGETYYAGDDIEIDGSNIISVNRTSLQNFFDTIYVKLSEIVGLVGNWSEDKSNYYNTTQSDDRFINRDGDTNITGNFYFNSSYVVYDNNSNNFFYDIDGEYHHQNADAETLDEVLANVFITPLNITTFHNSTGDYVNITSEYSRQVLKWIKGKIIYATIKSEIYTIEEKINERKEWDKEMCEKILKETGYSMNNALVSYYFKGKIEEPN